MDGMFITVFIQKISKETTMRYTQFGNTGKMVSALGFGAMRLPSRQDGDKKVVDEDLAIPLMRHAFDMGVNYIDTAPGYIGRTSEAAVGKAIKGYRDKVYISTKNGIRNTCPDDFMVRLESSLTELDVDYIDFYHLWGIKQEPFKMWQGLDDGPVHAIVRAKEQGLIKHISFSYHDKPENFKYIVDSGIFESVLIQYNMIDRSNEDNLAYAKEKGLGVVVMGPVGGGRLGAPSDFIKGMLSQKPASSAEMALRFVLANPHVDVALSGMSEVAHISENAKIADTTGNLTPAEIAHVKAMMDENAKLAQLYCTACDYCKPCPLNIDIPYIFELMNNHRVFGLTEHSKFAYKQIIDRFWPNMGPDASHCTACGECEKKCPQNIPIIEQLKETHATLV